MRPATVRELAKVSRAGAWGTDEEDTCSIPTKGGLPSGGGLGDNDPLLFRINAQEAQVVVVEGHDAILREDDVSCRALDDRDPPHIDRLTVHVGARAAVAHLPGTAHHA